MVAGLLAKADSSLRSEWQFYLCAGVHALRHAAADGWSDDAELGHELREGFRVEGLRAVGEGVVWVVVDFDQEAVGACGYRGSGHRRDLVAAARAVGWVGQHRQVGKFLDDRDGGDVERVTRVGLERPDAAFAEDYVVVAAGEDVFGTHQEFLHGGGHAALEENWLSDFAEGAKEKVVLHVASAYLEDVYILQHHLDLRGVHDFADGEEAEFVGGFAHELEAGFAHALKGVWRCARLESARAKDFCAGFRDAFGDRENLLAGFDGARARGYDHFVAADFYAAS